MNAERIVLCVHLCVLFVLDDYLTVPVRLLDLLVCWDMNIHHLWVVEKLKCGAVYMHFCAKEKV